MKKNIFLMLVLSFVLCQNNIAQNKTNPYNLTISIANSNIIECDKKIAREPNVTSWYFKRAISKEFLGDNEGAVMDYFKLISLDTANPTYFANLAAALFKIKKYKQADKMYTQAILLDGSIIKWYEQRAICRNNIGKREDALKDYSFYAENLFGVNTIDTYQKRGFYYLNTISAYDKAIFYFDEILKLDPQNILALRNRSFANHSLKQYQLAINDLLEIIKLNKEENSDINNLINLYRSKKDYDNAMKYANIYINKSYNGAYSYITRARLFELLGDSVSSRNDFNKALSICNEHIKMANTNTNKKYNLLDDYIYKIEIHNHFKDTTNRKVYIYDAIAIVKKLIFLTKIAPTSSLFMYYDWLGVFYESLLDYENSVLNYTKLIQLFPESFYGYLKRAQAYFKLKNYDAAIDDCNSLINIRSSNGSYYGLRASLYLLNKDSVNAMKDYKLALTFSPEDTTIQRLAKRLIR